MLWPSGASLLATVGSFIHTLAFSSAAKRGEKTQYTLPFALAWLMPELLSPHFIWWSSASSPPLLLIRHGSPLSLPSPSPPPSHCDSSSASPPSTPLSLPPSFCALTLIHPSLSFSSNSFTFSHSPPPPFSVVLHHFRNMPPPTSSSAIHCPTSPCAPPVQLPPSPPQKKKKTRTGEIHSLFPLPPQWMARCHSST